MIYATAPAAAPVAPVTPVAAAAPFYGYPAVTATQFHAQDELGQARFGYAHPGQASTNYRDAFGNQIGSYAYFNPEGKEVRVSYVADHRGFRVLSNDLPVAPVANLVAPVQVQDTPEVAKAKADHLLALNAAKTPAAAAPATSVDTTAVVVADAPAPAAEAPAAAAPVLALPVPVQDTPEVAAAKLEHAARWAAAKAAADAAPDTAPVSRKKRQVLSYASPFGYNFGYSPLAYSGYYGSPFGYNYGMPFGYFGNNAYGYNFQYPLPYSFGTPVVAGRDATTSTTTSNNAATATTA